MEISLQKLYAYDDVRRLLYCSGQITCIEGDNAPMNSRPIKIHKGVDNHLKFRVFDPDRKPVLLSSCSTEVFARLVSCDTHESVLDKKCKLGTAKGMIFLDLLEGDILPLPPGSYSLVLQNSKPFVPGTVGEYVNTPFFTDYDGNVAATVEITAQAQRDPIPSHIITEEDWTPSRLIGDPANPAWTMGTGGPLTSQGYSTAIPGARVRNYTSGNHTMSVQTENFTGILEILGTLAETPDADPSSGNEWFRIPPSSLSEYIEFTQHTGTDAFVFKSNVMWIKFLMTPAAVEDSGKIVKIMIRS